MWHRIWEECGRPAEGVVSETAKHAKQEYKRAVKWLLRHQDELSNAKMATTVLQNRERNFWSEVRKKTYTLKSTPSIVDGIEGDEIGDLFRDKFDRLYNCVSYNEVDVDDPRAE